MKRKPVTLGRRKPRKPSVDDIVAKLQAHGLRVVVTGTAVRIAPAERRREFPRELSDLFRALEREGHPAVQRSTKG